MKLKKNCKVIKYRFRKKENIAAKTSEIFHEKKRKLKKKCNEKYIVIFVFGFVFQNRIYSIFPFNRSIDSSKQLINY